MLFAFIPEEDTYIGKDGKRYYDPTCGDSFEVIEIPEPQQEKVINHGGAETSLKNNTLGI